MTKFLRSESETPDYAAIAHSVSVLQTQNTALQTELAQCRQELAAAKTADRTLAASLSDLNNGITNRDRVKAEHLPIEAALCQSEEWLKLTIDLNQIGLWHRDFATGSLTWNHNNYRLLGYDPDEVEPNYQQWKARVHGEDLERVNHANDYAIQNHTDYETEYRVIHLDGSTHWLTNIGRCIYDSVGQPVRMLGVAIDITERKVIEQDLRKSTKICPPTPNSGGARDQSPPELGDLGGECVSPIEEAFHDLNRDLKRHVQAQTQQLRASEASLRQQEQEFRTLAENSPDGIFRFDLAFRYLYLNPAAEKTLRLPRSLVLGKRDRELNLPTESVAFWEQTLQTVMQTQTLLTVEFSAPAPNGRHWFQSHNIPEFDASGNLISILVIEREITTLKQTEAALRQSEQRFQRLAVNIPGIIFQFRVDTTGIRTFPYISPQFEALFGISAAVAQRDAEVLFNCCHPDDRASLEASVVESFSTLNPWQWEGRFITPSGQIIWLQGASKPELQPNGDMLWDGILMDVSDRKCGEIAQQQTKAALHQSESRFQRLLANLPGVIYQFRVATDGTQVFSYISSYFEQLYEIPVEAVLQDANVFLNCCHPDDRASLEASIAVSYKTLQPWIWEGRFVTPSGRTIWIQAASNPELQPNDDVVWDGMVIDISDRKRSEAERQQAVEALRYSEEQLRAIFNNAPIAISLADIHNHQIVTSNAAHSQLLGYSDEEFAKMTFVDFTHPDDVSTDIDQLQQLIAGSQSRFQMEKRYITKNGAIVLADLIVTLICDRDGNPRYSLGMFQDITAAKQRELERQQAEAALRQSEEQFRTFFENSPIAIGLATLDGNCMVRTNAKYQEMLGYSDPELCQMTFMDLTHPDDIAADLSLFNPLLSGSTSRFQMEKRYICKNGDIIWVDLTVALIYDPHGKPLYSLCMPQDITEAKRLDAQRRQTEEALRRSQASLAEAQRVAHVGSWEVDLTTQQGSWSAELFRLFGLAPDQPKPTAEQIIQFIHPDDRPMYHQVMERAFEQGEPHAVDHRLVRTDGSIAWISSLGQVERNADGQVTRHFGVALDISDRKQAEANLRRSLQEKEVLLKEVHHRVKNNLQIISSLLRMQSRKVDNLQTFTVLQEAQNRVQSMGLIHEQLYQSADLTQIDLNEYLHSLVSNLFRSYGISHQQVGLNIETNDICLNLNIAISCGLIINELVSNSLKYAFPTDQLGHITICLTSVLDEPLSEWKVTLFVIDNGVGIPATVDWQNSPSLGTRIVRNLVHQIKGEMTLLPQAGTAFQITFPIADSP